MDPVPKIGLTEKHYGFAFIVFLLWSYLIYRMDHVLGCPASQGFMYNTHLHIVMLCLYMASHSIVIHQVERINKPTIFSISKMGTVLILLRRLKFFLIIRIGIISCWLYIVFYLNAEETYIPVLVLTAHLFLVIYFIRSIKIAISIDNERLFDNKEKIKLSPLFHIATCIEIIISIIWFIFNIVDVQQCHEWYVFDINW